MIEALLLKAVRPASDKLVDYALTEPAGSTALKDQGQLRLNLSPVAGGSTAAVYDHPTFGKCIQCNGTAGLATAATDFGGRTVYSVNFDYMVTSRSNAVLITHVSWYSGGASFGIMALTDGRLQLYFNGGQRIYSTAIALNVATNVRIVVNGNAISLYVNGTLVGTYTGSTRTEPLYRIGIGSAYEDSNGAFYGYIKNIWIKEGIVLP